jgi:ribosome maturation factor RimP
VTARVLEVDGDGVTLAVEAKGKPGAKKRPPTRRQVPWQELGTGRVQVEFGRGRAGEDGVGEEPQDATAQPDPADDDDGGGQ